MYVRVRVFNQNDDITTATPVDDQVYDVVLQQPNIVAAVSQSAYHGFIVRIDQASDPSPSA